MWRPGLRNWKTTKSDYGLGRPAWYLEDGSLQAGGAAHVCIFIKFWAASLVVRGRF